MVITVDPEGRCALTRAAGHQGLGVGRGRIVGGLCPPKIPPGRSPGGQGRRARWLRRAGGGRGSGGVSEEGQGVVGRGQRLRRAAGGRAGWCWRAFLFSVFISYRWPAYI